MRSTLILPTENCVDSNTIKRALLNYEKVYLKNPEDRDFVSGNDLMSIVSNAPGMSFGNSGLAKPLGKVKDHDLRFEQLLSEFKLAIDEGSLQIMDKPNDIYHNGVGIAYHIDDLHRFVYWNYRNMLADENFIKSASKGLDRNWLKNNEFDLLAPTGGDDSVKHADERLNNKIPFIGKVSSEEELQVLTRMIHARIASISRNLMLCEIKGLVPFTTNLGYSSVVNQLQNNFSDLVSEANDGSLALEELDLIGKVENVMFTDFLDQDKIDHLTVKQTLKLRTKIWGKFENNKSSLEESLLKIALDTNNLKEFENKIKNEYNSFLTKNQEFIHERKNLGIKLACNFGALGTSSSFGPSVIQSFVSAPSLEILLALACPMSLIIAEKRIPEVRNILKQQKDLRKLPGYDLFKYYKKLN